MNEKDLCETYSKLEKSKTYRLTKRLTFIPKKEME